MLKKTDKILSKIFNSLSNILDFVAIAILIVLIAFMIKSLILI